MSRAVKMTRNPRGKSQKIRIKVALNVGHKRGMQTYKATSTLRHTLERGMENICDLEKDKSRNIVSMPVFTPHEVTCHNTGVTIVATSLCRGWAPTNRTF